MSIPLLTPDYLSLKSRPNSADSTLLLIFSNDHINHTKKIQREKQKWYHPITASLSVYIIAVMYCIVDCSFSDYYTVLDNGDDGTKWFIYLYNDYVCILHVRIPMPTW